MNLNFDAYEAARWIKTCSEKYTKDLQEEKPDKRLYSVTSKKKLFNLHALEGIYNYSVVIT